MNVVQGESGAWAVHHQGKPLWGGYQTKALAQSAADAGMARMLKTRSERLLRLIELTDESNVPAVCFTTEIKLITAAMAEIEARWGESSVSDSDPA